ncbi:MAG: NUDIX domain-containing protein [Bacteroidia bacterium]|nr:NUDIX domain-containing protein [Bacteroidia bacterium]
MEFFALNLCVQLTDKAPSPFYDFPLMDWPSLKERFDSENLFEGQSFYVKAEKEISWINDFFEFQTIEKNRLKHATVVVRFENRTELEKFRNVFLGFFKTEMAAGGLVQNEKQELLFISTQNHWTLPKGHVEKNEETDAAAIREVCEETGLQNPVITGKLSNSYHTFQKKGKWRWKITCWYQMKADSKENISPQTEENIEAVEWFDKELWEQNTGKTFNQHKKMLREFYYECNLSYNKY